MGRTEAVEYRGFRVIEIWELQDDLVAGWSFGPFVHMSGLHAADMHKIDLPQEIWPRKVRRRFCVTSEASDDMAFAVPHPMAGEGSTSTCRPESFKPSNIVGALAAILRKNHLNKWERARCRILPNASRMPWSSASGRGGQPGM